MPKPQPSTFPFTNAFSGGDLLEMRGVTEHYFPSKYNELVCNVSHLEIKIKNFREMEIRVKFKINGSKNTVEGLYEEESWKFMRTESLLERFPEANRSLSTPAPLFSLMLNKYLQVVDASMTRNDGRASQIIYDTDADMLAMPTSCPPLTTMGIDDRYVYYDKKSVVFYSDLVLGVEYDVKVLLEANAATFEFAPLFPFGKVVFENISTVNESEFDIEPNALKVSPVTSTEFPEWFQYQLDKLLSHEPRMPRFRPALPNRGSFPAFELEEQFKEMLEREMSEDEMRLLFDRIEVDLSKSIELQNYQSLRFGFMVGIPPDKNIDVIVRTIKRPLPTRIYEQMQKLPHYRDALVEYTIFNMSHEKMRLRIETEILGYTEKEMKVIYLYGLNKKDRKAQVFLTQCPRLKKDILEQLTIPAKATMLCKVVNEDTKETLFEETFPIDILANDEMLWELQDLRSNATYNLRDFVCSWITPTDREGLIDKVRSGARAYHPDNTLGHNLTTLGDLMLHVKAVYDYLANTQMNYLSQPFSSKTSGKGQRVILPENVLKNSAGNCIDLTILFASILEGFGVYSLLFLTPTHAFIGWGNKNKADEMFFLETTLIGRADFETAMKAGRKAFEDNFMMNGGSTPIYMPDLRRLNGNFIVDTQKARHSGQIAVRNT